jgi:elongation factor P--beta-lysine ligase
MKVDILKKEETYKIRHVSLTLQVEESGRLHTIKVTVVEDYDVHHDKYTYEFESFNWLSDIKDINANAIEEELENYLVDNIENILT